MNEKEIYEDLIQAGCTEKEVMMCMDCLNENELEKAIVCIQNCRSKMLEELHSCERKLECLDYIIYEMKQHRKE